MALNFLKTFLFGATALLLAVNPFVVFAEERGPVTNLPLPRFVSMKAKEGNVRRGPGLTHRIDWVFKHVNTPMLITAEYGHWRRVQDKDGQGGWIHYALLSGVRTVIVNTPNLTLRIKPNTEAAPAAYAEEGAIAHLEECQPKWCLIEAGGHEGWALKTDLWGVWEQEVLE